MFTTQYVLLMPLALLLVGLTLAVLTDPYIRPEHRGVMLFINALCLVLIAQNLLEYRLAVGTPHILWRTAVSVCGYSVRPVILILFLYIVQPEGKRRPLWVLAGINAAIYLSAFLSPVSFWIDEYNCYHAGPAAPSCLLVSLFLLADLFRNTVKNRRIIGKRGLWIPSFVLLMILFSIYLDYNIKEGQVSISCLTIAITVGSVFYYIWLHQQFVQKHEQDMMAAQRIRIMMSQIQPHFLYNTIATFKALAGKNPEKAEEVAEKFSVYLRQNLDSLSIDGCIPFEKELEHTRTYAEIEMVRFENVRVEFDLQDLDFGVPPLSLQPLVENAIRHGVRIREEGIVRVSTRRTADGHEIVVADNGEGFDIRVIEEAAGKHIGIRNVRERIETMCGGTLQIDSKCGEGTTVTIRIPAKEAAA
ncbi:MAG: histidine kinase [Oscillospiraceae bacterium]|nr:histidine kinase [Oscillospiraceae bacterium]